MRLTLLLTLLLIPLAGCGGTTEETEPVTSAPESSAAPDGTRENPFVGRGTLEEIGNTQVVIAHDTIPGFMSAMTMSFPIVEGVVGDSLAVGDEVTFRIELVPEGYQIFSLEETEGP